MSRFHATAEERERCLPGDELVADALISEDHAVSLPASPERVWPWLAQMGAGRAGWYSYDFLDNGGVRSARALCPQYQDIGPGTVMPALPGARDAFVVLECEAPRLLLLGVPGPTGVQGETGRAEWQGCFTRASWVFVLQREGAGCRLHVRARTMLAELEMPVIGIVRIPGVLAGPLGAMIHGMMARRQLRGLLARVRSAAGDDIPATDGS